MHDEKLKIELIMQLAKSDNSKKAATLIKDFRMNIEDFPEV